MSADNKLRILRSAVPGRAPTVEQCGAGTLAMNTADKKLYFGSGDEVHEVAKKSDLRAAEEWNHAFEFATGATTTITATKAWVSGTSRLYVGGQRQKLGVDYVETSTTVITLTSVVTQAEYDAGVNIVLDFSIA